MSLRRDQLEINFVKCIITEQNRTEQNFIRTPVGYKAREDTIYI